MRKRSFDAYGPLMPAYWEGSGILAEAAEKLAAHFGDRILAIGDANTLAAAPTGLPALKLSGAPQADERHARLILRRLEEEPASALVAIGSGTINDLCKYAAHRRGLPYAVIATAPSMNGYASANASMTMEGYKTTLPCRAPEVIVADWQVLAAAPRRMIAAGFADALCRCTAQPDWLLSHLLLDTPYDATLFAMQRSVEDAVLARLDELAEAAPEAVGLLMEWLVLGGLAMNLAGGSYPASQGEHLIAHACDMMGLAKQQTLHGELVAVCMLAMAQQQATMLDSEGPVINALDANINQLIQDHLGQDVMRSCLDAYTHKQARLEMASSRLRTWPEITGSLRALTRNPDVIRDCLQIVGAPVSPADLGIAEADFAAAKTVAPFVRDRFTFLDLA